MDISNKLQKIKDKKSYSIPAKRLKEHLKPLLSKSKELEKRWMWELIQNATDLGDDISIRIIIENDYLSFGHNGKPFTLTEAYNLIMPDSGKDDEHNNNKSVIGQFGTGFISTHILSRVITVSGIAVDEDDDEHYEFEFNLDRTDRKDKEKLIKSIKNSEKEFKENLKNIGGYDPSDGLGTVFNYDLNQTYEGIDSVKVVSEGLNYFFNLIPFVFSFRSELNSIELLDNRDKKEIWNFKKVEEPTEIDELNLLKIVALKNGKKQWEKIIGSISESETKIAFGLKSVAEDKYEVEKFPKNCSKLFCAFPMIGTDDFNFPVIIESREFIPNEARDGIELSEFDSENREIIEAAKDAYLKLIEIIEDYDWIKAFNICSFSKSNFKDSEINNWFNKNVTEQLETAFRSKEIIDSVNLDGDDIRISLSDGYIPYVDKRLSKSKKILDSIFELASEVIPERIPNKQDFKEWNKAIDFEIFENEKLSLDTLMHLVSGESSLIDFQEKFIKTNKSAIAWINKLIAFAVDQKSINLFDEYALIPNQSGYFEKLPKLKIDKIYHKRITDGFDEILKDVYLNISKEEIRDELIHNEIKHKKEIKKEKSNTVSFKEFTKTVDTEFMEYSGDRQDISFLSALQNLFSWYNGCGLSPETLSECFPWFSVNKLQLYGETQNPEQRNLVFDIQISGKTKSLSKLAKSEISEEELDILADNPDVFHTFINWLNNKVKDNPNKELGDIGEEFVFQYLKETFGEEHVVYADKDAFDFQVLNEDKSVRYYIDAKTTSQGIGNSDNIPFYMRYAQWNFLPLEKVLGKYLIARVFKTGGVYDIRFLNIQPESFN